MGMEKIKIGIVGCANIAKRSVIPALLQSECFELVAVASRTEEKAIAFANEFDTSYVVGYEHLLQRNDIDAVYLPLPTGLHDHWVKKCINYNKHILCEKSLAIDFETAKDMVVAAKSKGLVLMENYMFEYHHQHTIVKDIISSGDIGEIRALRASFGFSDLPKDNFRFSQGLGGGALLDVGGYTLKACSMFLGNELKVESSFLKIKNGVDLYGGAMLTNNQNQFAHIAFGFDNYYQCNYEIWGSKGLIKATKAYTPKPDFQPEIIIDIDDQIQVIKSKPDNHFINIAKEFHRTIKENEAESKYKEILIQSKLQNELLNKAKEING